MKSGKLPQLDVKIFKCLARLCRTIEKLDVKDDRVRALEEEKCEVQRQIETQRQAFADRQDLLKSDHEMLLNAVNYRITYLFTVIFTVQRMAHFSNFS